MPFSGFALRTERSAAYNHEPGRGKEVSLTEDGHEGNHLWCSRCRQEFPNNPHSNLVCPTCGCHLSS
jgi:Zn finger protein HypA/HybF involved in hydrogenase expression